MKKVKIKKKPVVDMNVDSSSSVDIASTGKKLLGGSEKRLIRKGEKLVKKKRQFVERQAGARILTDEQIEQRISDFEDGKKAVGYEFKYFKKDGVHNFKITDNLTDKMRALLVMFKDNPKVKITYKAKDKVWQINDNYATLRAYNSLWNGIFLQSVYAGGKK